MTPEPANPLMDQLDQCETLCDELRSRLDVLTDFRRDIQDPESQDILRNDMRSAWLVMQELHAKMETALGEVDAD